MFSSLLNTSSLAQFASTLSLDNLREQQADGVSNGSESGENGGNNEVTSSEGSTNENAASIASSSLTSTFNSLTAGFAASIGDTAEVMSRISSLESKLEESALKYQYLERKTIGLEKDIELKDECINGLRDQLLNEAGIRKERELDSNSKIKLLREENEKLRLAIAEAISANESKSMVSIQTVQTASNHDEIHQQYQQQLAALQASMATLTAEGEALKVHNRRLEDELAASNDRNIATAAEIESLHKSVKTLEKTGSEVDGMASRNRHLEKELAASNDRNAAIAAEIESLRQTVRDLERTGGTLSSDVDGITSRNRHLEKELAASNDRNAAIAAEIESLRQTIRDLEQKDALCRDEVLSERQLAKEKDKTIDDLQSKLRQLTEKMREIMKKYTDAKAACDTANKETAAARAELESASAAASSHQIKESEVLGLKLKLENAETICDSLREKKLIDDETIASLQKEILRNRARIQEFESDQHLLQTECGALKDSVRIHSSAQEQAELRCRELEGQVATLTEDAQNRSVAQMQIAAATAEELSKRLEDVLNENRTLTARLQEESSNNKHFEDYKKRAQLALKNANQATATATGECSRLQGLFEDHELKTRAAEKRVEELDAIITELRETNNLSVRQLEARLQELTNELEAIVNDRSQLSEQVLDYKSRVESLTAELAAKAKVEHITSRLPLGQESVTNHQSSIGSSSYLAAADSIAEVQDDASQGGTENNSSPPEAIVTKFATVQENTAVQQYLPRGYAALLRNASSGEDLASRSMDREDSFGSGHLEEVLGGSQNSNIEVHDVGSKSRMPAGSTVEIHRSGLEHGEQLVLVTQLMTQLENMRVDLVSRDRDINSLSRQVTEERAEKQKLVARVDQLTAFLERTQKLQDSPESAVNIEYLKNCIFKYMSSTRRSERMRLFPVIATILKLTQAERLEIENALKTQASLASQLASSLTTATSNDSTHNSSSTPVRDGAENDDSLLSSISSYAGSFFS